MSTFEAQNSAAGLVDGGGSEDKLDIVVPQEPQLELKVGDIIQVRSESRVYAGVLQAFEDYESQKMARVKYFEFETEVLLPMAQLERLPSGPLARKDIHVGWIGDCFHAAVPNGGQWSSATVVGVTTYGAAVKYTDHGIREEVPIAFLRPLEGVDQRGSKQGQLIPLDAAAYAKSLNKIQLIPEHLNFLATDTEEEKASKLRRIKAIKNKNRLVRREQETLVTVQSWQSFKHKRVDTLKGASSVGSDFKEVGIQQQQQKLQRKRPRFDIDEK